MPLAIVGIGCRLPGGIESPTTLWQALAERRDLIGEVPETRWSRSAFHHPDAAASGMSYSRWAGLVERPEEFDAAFFGITPREAQRLDPQQRWFLEATWRALEDAGLRIEDLRGRPVGVYVGCSSSDYGEIQRRGRYHADLHTNTGAAVSLIANRVSYAFDLRGPSLVVDTACSSSLVALDLGAAAIRNGQCEAIIVGGANALFMPEATIGFSKAAMLARDGRCKAFDARADGYVRAEGAIALVLKPFERAHADGDRVYACVLSTAVNQDGQTSGITMPSGGQQQAMIETAYDGVVDSQWVGAIEAHGTGTPVGDPIEAVAIGTTLGKQRTPDNALRIGSIKTNLGHLEPASGAAGLAKLALSLYHRQLPPNLHFERGNPAIDFEALGLRVITSTEAWPVAPDGRCYGGVNSFGFGGTNAHAVLATPPANGTRNKVTVPLDGPWLWPISARNPAALQTAVADAHRFVTAIDAVEIPDHAKAQARRRSGHSHRLAVVADHRDDFLALLQPGKAISREAQLPEQIGRRLFIFSGQGSQWSGMASDLTTVGSVAADMAERLARLMPHVAGRPLLQALREPDPAHADRTDVVQPLLFVQQVMLAAQLESWGITADAVCGHSVGEIAAAWWAGALTLKDAVAVVVQRSQLQETTRGSGAMFAMGLSVDQVEKRLAAYRDLHIAAVNAPSMVTVAGDALELERFRTSLNDEEMFVHRLPMPYAFHSPHMDTLKGPLLDALAHVAPRHTRMPFFSTVSGCQEPGTALDAQYWWNNLRAPVRFADAVTAAVRGGHRFVIELGPQPALLRSAADCAAALGEQILTVATLQKGQTSRRALLETVGETWCHGLEPNWAAVYPAPIPHKPLPVHPWQRQKFWLEAASVQAYRTEPVHHPLLGRRIYGPGARWEAHIDLVSAADLADHRIRGDVVFPAAAYVEQMLATGCELFGNVPVTISHLELDRLLVLDQPRSIVIARNEISGRVQISSDDGPDQNWVSRAHARVLPSAGRLRAPEFPTGNDGAAVEIDDLYRRLHEGGNSYGPRFRCIRALYTDGQQAWGRLALDQLSTDGIERYRFHPALLDSALQMLLELLRLEDRVELYIPLGVDRISLSQAVGSEAYCLVRNTYRSDNMLGADIFIYDQSFKPIAVLQGCRCRAIEASPTQHRSIQALAWQWAPRPVAAVGPGRASWRFFGFSMAAAEQLMDHIRDNCAALSPNAPSTTDPLICWFRLTGAEFRQATQDAVLALTALVKQHSGSDVRLHLVTEGATIGPGIEHDNNASTGAVWALGRSLITEGAMLVSGMTDLEPATDMATALLQIGTDLRAGAAEVAWRNGQRYEHRLCVRPFRQFSERTLTVERAKGYGLELADHGGFDALHWRERVPRQPGPGQIAIAIEACGINFRDILKILDLYPLGRSERRWLGDECAGRVAAVGPGVQGFANGDAVVAITPGCMASDAIADARLVATRPAFLKSELCAGVPIAFLTAWYGLVEQARLQAGETVLIHAAAGGVGQAAVQIARWLGARVLATAGGDKQSLVSALGAATVFDSRDLSFAEGVRTVAPDGVDVVLNSLAGDALVHSIELLKPFGRFVELGKRDIFSNRTIDLRSLRDNRSFHAVDLALWLKTSPAAAGQCLRQIFGLLEDGRLQPVQTRALAFRDALDGFRSIAQGQHIGKIVLRVTPAAAPTAVRATRNSVIRSDATYLITGGTTGLGLLIAHVLAKAGARHLVLVSRRGAIAEHDAATVNMIRTTGTAVHIRACDVSDSEQTKALLEEIRSGLPRIGGIVHGAMVLDDVPVVALDTETLARVLQPKAWGAWNLSDLTANDDLDFFVLQSSIAAGLGSPGQANYVVANYLLEVLAAQRRRRGQPAQVIAWGPIGDIGVVARSEQLQHYFERLGLKPLTSDSIADAFIRIIGSGEDSITICDAEWSKVAFAMPNFARDTRFRDLVDTASSQGDSSLIETLHAADPKLRQKLLVDLIKAQAASVLGVAIEEIPNNRPLSELGLDSLMAFELSALLEAKLNSHLPFSALQGNRTVGSLADQLDRVLSSANRNSDPAIATPDADPPPPTAKNADIQLQYLPSTLLVEPATRFEAAALTYIPEQFFTKGEFGPSELQAALGTEPFLSGLVDAPIGRLGIFMLPLRASELFSAPDKTRELAQRAMQLASQQGSKVMTLTGLLPAATAYGKGLVDPNGSGQSITTGHALTTATIIANLTDLLHRCGRQLETERLAVIGLGSVGRSVLELLFRTLPHPDGLVLCDLYVKAGDLDALSHGIRERFHYQGDIAVVAGDMGVPKGVWDATLIVSAVDRVGVIDPLKLKPGAILLDDSYPPTFDMATAWRRMDDVGDVVIASGGFARFSAPVREIFYVPSSARSFLSAFGEENFIAGFQRDSCDYTACVFAGPLALMDPSLPANTGIPTPADLEAYYRAFQRYQLASAKPHCGGRLIPDALFVKIAMQNPAPGLRQQERRRPASPSD